MVYIFNDDKSKASLEAVFNKYFESQENTWDSTIARIAQAISAQGVSTALRSSPSEMVENIGKILTQNFNFNGGVAVFGGQTLDHDVWFADSVTVTCDEIQTGARIIVWYPTSSGGRNSTTLTAAGRSFSFTVPTNLSVQDLFGLPMQIEGDNISSGSWAASCTISWTCHPGKYI